MLKECKREKKPNDKELIAAGITRFLIKPSRKEKKMEFMGHSNRSDGI